MPVFLFLAFFTTAAGAQQRWGIRAGVVEGEWMVGGEMILRLGGGFFLNPNVEVSNEVVSANTEFTYAMDLNRFAAAWLGVGAALVIPDGQDLDAGVNLVAGLGKRVENDVAYVQFKTTVTTSSDRYGSVAVGYRF